MHRTTPTTKNYPAPTINSAKVEKFCSWGYYEGVNECWLFSTSSSEYHHFSWPLASSFKILICSFFYPQHKYPDTSSHLFKPFYISVSYFSTFPLLFTQPNSIFKSKPKLTSSQKGPSYPNPSASLSLYLLVIVTLGMFLPFLTLSFLICELGNDGAFYGSQYPQPLANQLSKLLRNTAKLKEDSLRTKQS